MNKAHPVFVTVYNITRKFNVSTEASFNIYLIDRNAKKSAS